VQVPGQEIGLAALVVVAAVAMDEEERWRVGRTYSATKGLTG